MIRDALIAGLTAAYAADCTVRRQLAHGDQEIFLVDVAGRASACVVRVLSVDAEDYFTDSFFAAADVLAFLEEQGYATERLIRAVDGRAIAPIDGWRLMVTTYEGEPLRRWQGESANAGTHEPDPDGLCSSHRTLISPADYFELGVRLGELHSLPIDALPHAASLPNAITLPARDLVWVAGHLAAQAGDVPTYLLAEYDLLLQMIASTDTCEGLPLALLHSDAHPGNAVRMPGGTVVLVDWEGAGLGPAIVDLGMLLSNCFDADFRPDRDAIAGAVDGYCQHRRPTADELHRLRDAMRFSTLVLLGGYFDQRASGRLTDDETIYGMTYRQWQAKLAVIDDIATIATTFINKRKTAQ